MNPKQIKSLDLLRQFVQETGTEEIREMVKVFQERDPRGITFEQYLKELNRNTDVI